MKYGKNKATEKQLEWLDILNGQGYKAVICYGFEQARETIEWYLSDER